MTSTSRSRPVRLAFAAAALIASAGLVACGDDDAADGSDTTAAGDGTTTEATQQGPTITDPWVRPATDLTASDRTAIYFEISGGSEDDALLSASVPSEVAGAVEVHETTTAGEGGDDSHGDDSHGDDSHGGGMMTMREVERIEVPAGETVVLEPGGYHVMLLDVVEALEVGDIVEVTLTFENAREIVVPAEVREP